MKQPQFDPRAEYAKLKAQVDSGRGMTARQWDWFDARMKEWEPEEYERRRKAASIRMALDYFEKYLAPAGYALIPPAREIKP